MLESKLGDKASIGTTTVKIEQKVSTPVAQKPPVAGNQKTSSALPKKKTERVVVEPIRRPILLEKEEVPLPRAKPVVET